MATTWTFGLRPRLGRDRRAPRYQAKLVDFRTNCLASVGYNASARAWSEVAWTRTTFVQPQMHAYDREFYDVDTKKYTVDSWLDGLEERYGGIDSALVWPTYTNIGIDDRSQFDLIRAMPGDIGAVVDAMHARGVQVLWPYNPWDTGAAPTSRNCGEGLRRGRGVAAIHEPLRCVLAAASPRQSHRVASRPRRRR